MTSTVAVFNFDTAEGYYKMKHYLVNLAARTAAVGMQGLASTVVRRDNRLLLAGKDSKLVHVVDVARVNPATIH